MTGENWPPENSSKSKDLSMEQSNSFRQKGGRSMWVKPHFRQRPIAQADTSSSAHILECCTGNSSGLKTISILCLKLILTSFSLSSQQSERDWVKVEWSSVEDLCVCVCVCNRRESCKASWMEKLVFEGTPKFQYKQWVAVGENAVKALLSPLLL